MSEKKMTPGMLRFEEELKKLPNSPGVYIMRDHKDTIMYVGKAVNLHNRVRSYFRENIGRGPMIDKMVSLIARFEYIVTDSELEALVLENNLIKEHRPKYNTLLTKKTISLTLLSFLMKAIWVRLLVVKANLLKRLELSFVLQALKSIKNTILK